MAENSKERNDLNKVLFMNLVMMLASSAMQQLGKLVNPMTNKTEVNLDGAQVTIDLLSMIQAKTKGNLDADEEKMLKDLLTQLQLNYVETSDAMAKRSDKQEPPAAEAPASEPKAPPPPTAGSADPKKDPKFRKSYGS